jgi:hypothetical protein
LSSFLGLIFNAPLDSTGSMSGASRESLTVWSDRVSVEKAPILHYTHGDPVRQL